MQLKDIQLPEFFTIASMKERFTFEAVRKTSLQKKSKKRKSKKKSLVEQIAALAAKLQEEGGNDGEDS